MRRRARKKPSVRKNVTLHIERLGAGGDGIAIDHSDTIYVPYVLPGEDVEADVTGNRATTTTIKAHSEYRITAPCRHFTQCGGCSLQHVEEEYYLNWKREQIITTFRRAGLMAEVSPILKVPPTTRRRAVFVAEKNGNNVQIGFQRARSHQTVDLSECVILDPALFAVRPALSDIIVTLGAKTANIFVTRCTEGIDVAIESKGCSFPDAMKAQEIAGMMARANIARIVLDNEPLMSTTTPTVQIGPIKLPIPPGGFLQASEEGQDLLIGLVADAIGPRKKIADLFCGSGTFALALARTASVVAVDSDAPAINALKVAVTMAQQAGTKITPVKLVQRNLFETPLQHDELSQFDAVVFDPPRAGAKEQATCLAKSKVPLVVGVSCNPNSFSRDAKILEDGGYTLTQVTPVDQFVYTPHIELVGVFERK